MGKTNEHPMGFLRRLVKNQAGNTLAIVAAAIFPLAGLIGGGVDMSRAYMVRSRMQQACDAAALAGRRSMTTATMTDADKVEAKKFFDFNFPQNTFGAATFAPTIQSDPSETTTVQVAATTTVPTTIMRIFGYETLTIAVNCNSRFDIGNTDVMLVLDTTGSMKETISNGSNGSITKLAAVQQAVKDFYDTLGAGSDSTGRIRYGFMPYSSTVNVGKSLPASYMLGGTSGETWDYQTRQRYISSYTSGSTTGSWTNTSSSTSTGPSGTASGSRRSCPSLPADTTSTSSGPSTSSTSTDSNGKITTTTTSTQTVTETKYSWDGSCQTNGNPYTQNYKSTVTVTKQSKNDTTTQTPNYSWRYGQYPLDISGFITGDAVPNPAYNASMNSEGLPSTSSWTGCIEERDTDSSINKNTSTGSIPDTAYDLQIDTLPSSRETKWRPHWPDVEFSRNNTAVSSSGSWMNSASNVSGGYTACPSQARRLTSYANRTAIPAGQSSSFNNYVDGLVAVGGTYHTIGMMWGARFLSPTGIFSADNASAPNGFNVSRHIVFMTDGTMKAYNSVYGAWGFQKLDRRDGPANASDDDLTLIHKRRMEMMCNAIKSKGITIWVIGFSDEDVMSSELQGCASSSNHWTMNYNAADLKKTFKDIAKNIGGLRLSQ